MIVVKKKNFFIGLVGGAVLLVGVVFWFAYFQNTDLYVSLFRSDAFLNDEPDVPIGCESVDASFVSWNVPTTFQAGESRSVTIVMRNSGCVTWTGGGYGFKLGSVNDDNTWLGSSRVYLQQDSVPANSNATFTFTVRAPSTAGNYSNFKWRMVWDDPSQGRWFGITTPTTTIQVIAPTSTPTATPTPTTNPTPVVTPNPTTNPTTNPTPVATPVATPTPNSVISCPINSSNYSAFFEFPNPKVNNRLRTDTTQADAIKGPFTFALPAGNYRVTLIGFDYHPPNEELPNPQYRIQPNEQFYLRLNTGSGFISTNPSLDIADDLQYSPATVTTDNLSVPQNVTSITAVHPNYPTENPNSVIPVCVGFSAITTPTPTPTPTPTATPNPTISCSPKTQNASVNQLISINGEGTSSLKAWSALEGTPSSGTGNTFSTRFATSGTKTIRINGIGGVEDTCTVNVVTTPTPTPTVVLGLSIEKLGENLTRQSGAPTNRVETGPNDVVRFTINVDSQANTTMSNLVIRDVLPNEMLYEPGTTRVNGVQFPDGVTANGVSIGVFPVSSRMQLTFNARVRSTETFQTGTTIIVNSAFARADGVSEREAKIPVTITKNILVPVGEVQTGVNGFILTLILSLFLTFAYYMVQSKALSLAPSRNVAITLGGLLILLVGSLSISSLLKSSNLSYIELRNPVVRSADGDTLANFGPQFFK